MTLKIVGPNLSEIGLSERPERLHAPDVPMNLPLLY